MLGKAVYEVNHSWFMATASGLCAHASVHVIFYLFIFLEGVSWGDCSRMMAKHLPAAIVVVLKCKFFFR